MVRKIEKKENQLIIYQAPSGAIEFKGDWRKETIWATQVQIAEVFGVERSVVTKHIQNIYKEKELLETATCAKIARVQREGERQVKRYVEHYNLDLVISVGYRVNSKTATMFRQWATKTLREHITKGYTFDRKRIAKNYESFIKAVSDIRKLLPKELTLDPKAVLDLIKEFATTWMSLDAYDKETIKPIGITKKAVKLTGEELNKSIFRLKNELTRKGEASELFATEREQKSVEGIVGNVMQSFGGKPVYPSIEEKAAHLLYFMVKNHPFIDGNKRAGAFAFIWFLRKYGPKASRNINQATLTALTLFVAQSNPKKKDLMVALITQLLQ